MEGKMDYWDRRKWSREEGIIGDRREVIEERRICRDRREQVIGRETEKGITGTEGG
jgi:hypothetical protein